MTLSKLLSPVLRSRLFFDTRPFVACCNAVKYKSTQSPSAVSSKVKSEVDANVKPLGEKVKETTKTLSYLGVIALGVAVTGTLFYAVFNELFSSKSPNNVYNKAMKLCINDPRVEDKLGTPISAYGEETRRGRRQHVSHLLYEKDGVKHLRMKFYLQGIRNKATVQLDMAEVIFILAFFCTSITVLCNVFFRALNHYLFVPVQ